MRSSVIRTGRTPLLRSLWVLVYGVLARAGVAYLTRGARGASTYVRGAFGTEDFQPGLSDVDLAIVLPTGAARARRRWVRLDRAPLVTRLLDWPRIYDQAEVDDLAGESVFTYGLDGQEPDRAAYLGERGGMDTMRMLERPGLYGATADWRLLRGPDRRPRERERDSQEIRVAAWLELVYWWRLAVAASVEPDTTHIPALCTKLVAEPARIWLWLAYRERADGRLDVLSRAARRLPEEEEPLRRAMQLQRVPSPTSAASLADTLPVLVRLSVRIARLIADELGEDDHTTVRLLGAEQPRLVGAQGHPEGALPLCDWRALACPPPPDESFLPVGGDPADLAVLAEAARAQRGRSYRALRTDTIMVLPARGEPLELARQRAVKCAVSDPVSFALLEGSQVARFPQGRGWSAADTARRAVAEHRAWLARTEPDTIRALGLLFTAARAALFLQSVERGEPELALTVSATAELLGAAEARERYVAMTRDGTPPPPAVVDELRRLVLRLPAYAGT